MDEPAAKVDVIVQTEPVARNRVPTRCIMLGLVFVGTVINYLDRTNVAVVGPLLKSEFGLSALQLGLVFSAFGYSYALANLPAGYIIDRCGTRLTYCVALSVWSLLSALQGLAPSFASMVAMRLGVGAAEAPAFPVNNRVVTVWFPRQERGFATSSYVMAQYVGLAFLTPLLFWLAQAFGWRVFFAITGGLGLAWALVWFAAYRDATQSRRLNSSERARIMAGGGLASDPVVQSTFQWRHVRLLLRHRKIWGVFLGKFSLNCVSYFYLTWFPTYLVTGRHMTMLKAGVFSSLPFMAATVGVLVGGVWSDWLLRRGASLELARKLPAVSGASLVTITVLAAFTSSDMLALMIFAVAFLAQGVSSMGWTMLSDLAPAGFIGTTGGIANFAGNLSAIVMPTAVGIIVAATESFVWALALASLFALLGAFSYTFLVGRMTRIQLDAPAS